jgi:Protein of unknown function (DUF1194).
MIKETDRLFSILELDIYYKECVVGGPAAFLIPVFNLGILLRVFELKLV